MKVYITQGHQKGIGLEVFFKTTLLLGKDDLKLLHLLAFEDAVKDTLSHLQLPFKILQDSVEVAGQIIHVTWLKKVNFSQSLTAIELGMGLCAKAGILFTLPTSKDQFNGYAGHTEFFRSFYQKPELGMFFSAPRLKVLLISDHIAIKNLSELMTEELIYSRLLSAITALQKWNWPINNILVSGLNPHSGEGGLIGKEDERIATAINRLKNKIKFNVSGPLPGDTMLFEQKSPDDLLVYLFHDQGLGVFKGIQGYIGSNITLGLPYPRFSPDHGTSFALFGKNQADYRGCAYSLKEAIAMLKRIHGKDSSHESKSS